MPTFTPTEQKIVNLLSDGRPHSYAEVRDCVGDELTERTAVQMHISRIRAKLAPIGEDIALRLIKHHTYYIHVRLLVSPYNPYR